MSFLRIEQLTKSFGPDPVFEDVSFAIEQGEFVCIIGHSGCGKSTILNILAGLDRPTSGAVVMDGREVEGPSLDRGVVFQGHALMPWMSVARNVGFAVRSRWPKWSRAQVAAQVDRFLALVGLTGSASKRPTELSGGMKQRVGIARAFSIQPKVLLLDEPFGALDALTRGVIQDELLKICAATRQTVFMITHDVDEAILLADKVLLMSNGPRAEVAEVVRNTMPRPRTRQDLHHDPQYYRLRNHLLDFLVARSSQRRPARDPDRLRLPPEVSPGLQADDPAQPRTAAR